MYESRTQYVLPKAINPQTLSMQMWAINVTCVCGSDSSFMVMDRPPSVKDAQIQAVIDAHDPKLLPAPVLTPEQIQIQQMQAQIAALRAKVGT